MIKSLYFAVKLLIGLAAKANADADSESGTALDSQAYEQANSGLVTINVGAATGSPSSFSIVYTLEHSSDNSSWSTAPGALTGARADATKTVTAAGVYSIPFEPGHLKRYWRVSRAVSITGGSSPKVPNGASVLLGDGRKSPM